MSDKRGKKMGSGWKALVWVVGIIAVISVIYMLGTRQTEVPRGTTVELTPSESIKCPSDKGWSGTITVQNTQNTSGAETFDTTMKFYEIAADGTQDSLSYNDYNQYVIGITDTTNGAVSLTCGKRYAAKILSSSGAAGDQSRIRKVISATGVQDAKVTNDGVLLFTATSDSGTITMGDDQNGVFELRAYDVVNDGFLNANASSGSGLVNGTSWTGTDGVSFNSTSATSSCMAVGDSGEFHVKLYARATNVDENVNDQGIYFLIDADTSTWDTPTVKIDGVVVQDIIDTGLNADEVKAYSSYEYAYLIPKDRSITDTNELEIDLQIYALGGQNPTAGPATDFAPIGSYASVSDGNLYKIGAVDDSSSRTAVYTLHDVDWCVA